MGHFHVGQNMPGYMPESEVFCTDNAGNALAAWRESIRRHIEELADDGDFLAADTAQNAVTVSDVDDGVWQDVENMRYWIEVQAEPIRECQMDDMP